VASLQTNGAPQVRPGQQRSPSPPQAPQKSPFVQVVHAEVQVVPLQHCSAGWPHAPLSQPPFMHVPPVAPHELPDATHICASRGPTQQPPSAQLSNSQQGWPGPPHVAHCPARVQTVPAATQ
jgi:hypothetical protein